jgi:malonyl CoA-acyl carrier protein transacylase
MKYPTIIAPMMVAAALKRSAGIGATLEDIFHAIASAEQHRRMGRLRRPNLNMTGVTPEQVTDALNGVRAETPKRKREEDFSSTR